MPDKILLLNPPGKKLYVRDYYCSKISKSNYLFHPVDLLMLSGRLAERYEVRLIDAIADRIDDASCLTMIDAISPDVIISLIGAVSLDEDLPFIKRLAKDGRRIVVSGDISLENTEKWLDGYPFIDAVILDFTSDDIIHYLKGNHSAISGMVYRTVKGISKTNPARPKNEAFFLPIPRHDLFSSKNYRFPFVRHKRFATVLTDYGCPFRCSFCVMSTLGYRYREVENVIEELKTLKRLGKKEIFFIDQTFGINKKRILDLCQRMKEEGFNLGWVCYSRVDLVVEEVIKGMKEAGCHTIIFGVESASEEILKKYQKGYNKTQIRDAFRLCKKYNIRTVATFILGLPEETEETANETIEFLKELDCDFASFNVAVPRMNTPLRQKAIREGLITSDLEIMDQGGASIAMPTRHLTMEQVQDLKKKAIRGFYLRPSYLWRRLKGVSSLYELKEQVSEGLTLLKGI
ncbi:MAG: radical SAM protein [Deltaproteobacteria bacterium]|nr:radical SAM protein [Deltaproteobacteria bacterium]